MDATMKAVILAAGKGTRMGELTANLPKPMLQVDGKPVLEHIIEGLRDEAKIHDLFIIIGWQGHVIRDYFGDGRRWACGSSTANKKCRTAPARRRKLRGNGWATNLSCWPAATSCCCCQPTMRCWWRHSGKTA